MGETNERTSATAVKFFSYSSLARSALVFPTFSTCFSNQYSPLSEWDTPPSVLRFAFRPTLCFEVTMMCEGVSAAMRMMQPLDLVVSSYGPVEYCGIASHCARALSISLKCFAERREDVPWSTRPR